VNRAIGACAALAWAFAIAADPGDGTDPAPQSSSLMTTLASPLLVRFIESSRDSALEQGVEKIPKAIRASLEGYVPKATLDRVRWRAGGGDLLSQSAFFLKDAQAITLDYVIVFNDENEARKDPTLWAHELRHVMQFEEWGVEGFATRYLTDSIAVEDVASEYRWQFMKLRGLVPAPSVPTEP
jgi:uncharacterized protein DUF4157